MAREDHQPIEGSIGGSERGRGEMRDVCGRTIAFILALEKGADGRDPDIANVLTAAKRAQVAAAIILAAPELADAAAEVTRNAGKKGSTFVRALEYDPAAAMSLTQEAGGFDLLGLPYGLLVTAHAVAESLLDEYEGVLIVDAAKNHSTADCFYELCLNAREHLGVDAVASLFQQSQCLPCWINRTYLERLAALDPTLVAADETLREPVVCACDYKCGDAGN